jgi:hypothetical protein
MYKRALAGFEKALGPDHTSTLDTISNVGLLYLVSRNLMPSQTTGEKTTKLPTAFLVLDTDSFPNVCCPSETHP